MLRCQIALLLGQPLERDLGFPASTGGTLNGAKALAVFFADGALELRAVGAKHAAKPSNGDPEIMKRLGIGSIVETAFGGARCAQPIQRQSAGGFFVASQKQVVGQRAAPLRLELPRLGRDLRRCLLRLGRIGNSDESPRVSSFVSDGAAPTPLTRRERS